MLSVFATRMLEEEVQGLIGRVQQVRPFSLHETMVPAALPFSRTLRDIDAHLSVARDNLIALARRFVTWLASGHARRKSAEFVYRRYVFLRLRMNAALTQFDLFADAITQRSESGTGVQLAGLDALAQDALSLERSHFAIPPLLCYLDRGMGAAIRRARTRLPGGGESPVAIVRVPRERMVGLGIASSLVHEAGHQGAVLLDLVPQLRQAMEPLLGRGGRDPRPWRSWYHWISEIVADLWSVARLGVASTLGLMNVVSLPRVFVFRANANDPHPTPWLRVLVSAEIGQRLYPHAQWARVLDVWRAAYPVAPGAEGRMVRELSAHVPTFVHWLLQQRAGLAAEPLGRLLEDPELAPPRLDDHVERWFRDARYLAELRPCQTFAVAGYCRLVRGALPVPEIRLFSSLLTRWALAERAA